MWHARASLALALGLAGGCVDWQLLSEPLPDAGTDGGTDVDAGPDGCGGDAPDEPAEPAAYCGSIPPLENEDWQAHPFVAPGVSEPAVGARVDQLVLVEAERVHLFCGEEEQTGSPVECPTSPRGPTDTAPDGTLVLGAAGGACVIRDDVCACSTLAPSAEPSAVAVVTPETFVLLVQPSGADLEDAPVLEERRLDDPSFLVGALLLSDVPSSPDVGVLTRLPRRCADPTTWAVAAHFPISGRLFTVERRATPGGLTSVELDGGTDEEALGVLAAPVGAVPGSATPLVVTRINTSLQLEARLGTLAPGARTDGAPASGGDVGYGDFFTGRCATGAGGRYACVGSAGLLVVGDPAGAPPLLAVPASSPRHGDSSGSAERGDDAWIFGSDFAARTSLSVPATPTIVRTNVVAGASAGARVVGAAVGERRLFVGSPGGSAVVHVPADGDPTVAPRGIPIDALAMGASTVTGDGVLAWVDRTQQAVWAVAIDDDGNTIGATISTLPALLGDAAVVDGNYPAGTVSLWTAGLDQLDPTHARVTLQACRASAPGGVVEVACTAPGTVDVLARDDVDLAVAMGSKVDHLFLAARGGLTTIALTPTRDGVGEVHSKLAPLVNGLDPLAGGVRSLAVSVDCLYLAAADRIVQPVSLWIGAPDPDDTIRFEPPLERELDLRALLTLGDDSIFAGAERGRLARFIKDASPSNCSNQGPGLRFAVDVGPMRTPGTQVHRPVFVGDDLYVTDEDQRVWRVPLP